MLAFSTCWNAHRHSDGEHLINEVLLLGFNAIEFSHGFGEALFPGFRKGFDQGRLQVSGGRHPCPAIIGEAPPSSIAVAEVKSSIDRVAEYRGSYLILSFGPDDSTAGSEALVTQLKNRGLHGRDYVKAKLALIERREAGELEKLQRAGEVIAQVLPHAESRKVRLALENRACFEQFPTAREIESLLAECDSPWLGYWHDFGHAERQAQLGFLDHGEQLRRLKPRLVGCHVHDLIWPDQDHQVPGQGFIDFSHLIPMLPKNASVVWEIQANSKTADIKAALTQWKETFS